MRLHNRRASLGLQIGMALDADGATDGDQDVGSTVLGMARCTRWRACFVVGVDALSMTDQAGGVGDRAKLVVATLAAIAERRMILRHRSGEILTLADGEVQRRPDRDAGKHQDESGQPVVAAKHVRHRIAMQAQALRKILAASRHSTEPCQ